MLILVISLLAGVALSLSWYSFSRRYNRRKATRVLNWIDSALASEGRVLGVRWITPSQFKAPLRLSSRMFHRAWIQVDLAPCQKPFLWLMKMFRKEPETIIFQADLESPPAFSLDIQNFRSFARSNRTSSAGGPEWNFMRTHPLVINAQTRWHQEVSSTMTSLAASGNRDYLNISFRRNSPHFSVTLPLDTIAPDSSSHELMLDMMRELAARSSAKLF